MQRATLSKRIQKFSRHLCVFAAVASAPAFGEIVQYEVTYDSNWSAETHPVDYPAGAHYSSHVGATHTEDFSLWAPGVLATPGMKALAERGLPSPSDEEVAAAIEAGTAYQFMQMPAVPVGARSRTFRVSNSHPLMSMASMIAPSPDWFVGFHDIDLREGGDWISETSVDAWPYDSGTDSGASYGSGDLVTETPEPIFRITEAPLEGTPRFGFYTIKLVSTPGDINESGAVDEGDIATLCSHLGTDDVRSEYTGDGTVGLDDLEVFVETRLGTRVGDANLDGEVGFDDFLQLSQNFGNDFRDWARGDFDCNGDVDFPDFLALSRNFGFGADAGDESGGETSAAAVPEPTGLMMMLASVFGLTMLRRRQR